MQPGGKLNVEQELEDAEGAAKLHEHRSPTVASIASFRSLKVSPVV